MPIPLTRFFGRNNELKLTSAEGRTANAEDDNLLVEIDATPTSTAGIFRMGVSAAWIGLGATANRVGAKFMFSSTAASGAAYGMQIRCKAAAAGGLAVGLNVSASNSIAATGGLQAIQGYAQPAFACTTNSTDAIVALYGKSWPADGLDTACRIWSLWVDNACTVKSTGGHYMARFSNNASGSVGAAIDGLFTVYQGVGMTSLANFEDAPTGGFLSASATGDFTKTHKLLVKIAGVTGPSYIQVGTIA